MKPRTKSIIEIFDEGTPIDRAARRAVRDALAAQPPRTRAKKQSPKPRPAKPSRRGKAA